MLLFGAGKLTTEKYTRKDAYMHVIVQVVKGGCQRTVNVVPPVADEELLVEDCLPGTEETVLPPIVMAIMVHLKNITTM